MIKGGKAYCDDTEKEKMQHERWHGIMSERHNATTDDNLSWFAEMEKSRNKKYIDPEAPRHTAILEHNAVTAIVKGPRLAPYTEDKPKYGKNPRIGTKKIAYNTEILIEQTDAQNFAQDEEITLVNWATPSSTR
ncbi:MAG: hypothetical protein Q9163_001152 [Psora crenata]